MNTDVIPNRCLGKSIVPEVRDMLIQLTVYKCGSFVNIHFILTQFPISQNSRVCLHDRKKIFSFIYIYKFKSILVPFREKYSNIQNIQSVRLLPE